MKQNASVVATESTEEQAQHRNSSSRVKRSAEINGSMVTDLPLETLNNEEQDKSATNNLIRNKEKENDIMEEDKSQQQGADKNDTSALELAGLQIDSTETT